MKVLRNGEVRHLQTGEDLQKFFGEISKETRMKRGTDPRWTIPFVITPRLVAEAVVIGHMRAWEVPPRGSLCDTILSAWASELGAWRGHALDMREPLIEFMPKLITRLRNIPSYSSVAERFFDAEAAEQNMARYLQVDAAVFARSDGDEDKFRALVDPPKRKTET